MTPSRNRCSTVRVTLVHGRTPVSGSSPDEAEAVSGGSSYLFLQVGKDGGNQSNILVFMSIGRLVIEGIVDMLASGFGAQKKSPLSRHWVKYQDKSTWRRCGFLSV